MSEQADVQVNAWKASPPVYAHVHTHALHPAKIVSTAAQPISVHTRQTDNNNARDYIEEHTTKFTWSNVVWSGSVHPRQYHQAQDVNCCINIQKC